MTSLRLLFLALLLGATSLAQASSLVHVLLEGTISSSDTSTFQIGESFTINFTYDTTAAGNAPGSTFRSYNDAVTAYTFNYNDGAYIGTASGRMFVYDNYNAGSVQDITQFDVAIGSLSFPDVEGESIESGGPFFYLSDSTATNFDSYALPISFPETWTSGYFRLNWGDDDFGFDSYQVQGSINSVTQIPEPSILTCFTCLLASCILILRRR
jgi:hypothetical protein